MIQTTTQIIFYDVQALLYWNVRFILHACENQSRCESIFDTDRSFEFHQQLRQFDEFSSVSTYNYKKPTSRNGQINSLFNRQHMLVSLNVRAPAVNCSIVRPTDVKHQTILQGATCATRFDLFDNQ
jgi:hypothetical protein